jgi:hypothetical protein
MPALKSAIVARSAIRGRVKRDFDFPAKDAPASFLSVFKIRSISEAQSAIVGKRRATPSPR